MLPFHFTAGRRILILFLILFFFGTLPLYGLVVVWTQEYGQGSAFDNMAWGLAVDGNSNVYIAGEADGGAAANVDFFTLKLDRTGVTQWKRQINGPGSGGDSAFGGAVCDASNNVYVTGYIWMGASYEAWTVKYRSDGTSAWTQRKAGCAGYAVAYDPDGYIIAGMNRNNGKDYDYFIVKYGAAGNTVWTQVYDGGTNDNVWGVSVDRSHNVYATGISHNFSDNDIFTIKYTPSGTAVWTQRYDPGGDHDKGEEIAADSLQNAYVTGQRDMSGPGGNFLIIKYGPSGGFLWSRELAAVAGWPDQGYGITVDSDDFVYAAGMRYNGVNYDAFIIKMDGSGNTVWTQVYNSGPAAFADDGWFDITLDERQSVYAAGKKPGFTDRFFVIKYLQPPNRPLLLSLQPQDASSVRLLWLDRPNESGYAVYRSTDASGFSRIAVLPADTVEYTDSGPAAGERRSYRVAATNAAGFSPFSGILTLSNTAASSAGEVLMAPNVYRPPGAYHGVTFFNVPQDFELKVYSVSGGLMLARRVTGSPERYLWDVSDGNGNPLRSGTYFCRILGDGGKEKYFKLTVVR